MRSIAIAPVERRTLEHSGELRAPRVLIVDDDAAVIESFARTLQLEGYAVVTAPNGEAAFHEVVRSTPDVIVLDLQMAVVDGLTFLRRLRAHREWQHTPVAVITGDYSVDEPAAQEMSRLGADVYFKPLWIEEFVAITRGLIARTDRSDAQS